MFKPERHVASQAERHHIVAKQVPHADDVGPAGVARFAYTRIREME